MQVVPGTFEPYVTFTTKELWMLHDVIRHEMQDSDKWKFPHASISLNDKIAEALYVCNNLDLKEYRITLSLGDCYAIDYHIRRDMKTPEGAKGEQILLKVFDAKEQIRNQEFNTIEVTYVDTYAEATRKDAEDASNSTNDNTS